MKFSSLGPKFKLIIKIIAKFRIIEFQISQEVQHMWVFHGGCDDLDIAGISL
jgi:hypothetical protein